MNYLGVRLNVQVTSNEHINHISDTSSNNVQLIKKAREYVFKTTALTLDKSLVSSNMLHLIKNRAYGIILQKEYLRVVKISIERKGETSQ